MSTPHRRRRALRPEPEGLEARQLLARSLSGIDVDGDAWVLRLVGPGDLRVTQQPDSTGTPVPLGQNGLIDTITIAGADPTTTRLVGSVKKAATGDGKVFFQTMEEIGGVAPGAPGTLGLKAIDMPNFWLGQTATTITSSTAPSISIPDGVLTLRFGGADVTYAPPGVTPPSQSGTASTFTISLGLPRTWGTSVVVDKMISGAEAPTTSGGTPIQHSIVVTTLGRLNTFQANEIDGNATYAPTGFSAGGGTVVQSIPVAAASLVGQIGFVRVGGNATNFSTQTSTRISNFYIGGETNQVNVLAPEGSRNIQFGKGMDNVSILSHYIETLQANRGAVNSSVIVDRNINRVTLGGDVVNTTVLSGYNQNLATIFQNQQPPTSPPAAQAGGAISNVLIAGDVVDSIFAASVDPYLGAYDDPQALVFPTGHISAKVEGTINNAVAAPLAPNQAFFAKVVKATRGPVIPPMVPELPFPHPNAPPTGPRVIGRLQPVARPSSASTTGK